MRIISIDPGLDLVALAVFEYDGGSRKWAVANAEAKVKALIAIVTIKTLPADTLDVRLGHIYTRMREVLASERARAVFVETPAVAGAYASRGRDGKVRNAAAMQLNVMALGVILAACDAREQGNEVRLCKASKEMKKSARLAFTRGLMVDHWPNTYAKAGQDKLDAVYVGLAQSWPTL